MIDLNNKNIKMTHDGYLKLYQIKKPQLTKYDVILIDEAQDLTPGELYLIFSVSSLLYKLQNCLVQEKKCHV